MIKYYLHIVDLINNGNVLMEAALEESFKLCKENKTCWLTSVRYLLKFLGIDVAKITIGNKFMVKQLPIN